MVEYICPSNDIIITCELFLNILNENQIECPKIMVSGKGEIGLYILGEI
jgi:hypothetical protein